MKQNLIHPSLTDSFKFMAILNLRDLTEIEVVVEYFYLSARIINDCVTLKLLF